jgi:hypothetical protein
MAAAQVPLVLHMGPFASGYVTVMAHSDPDTTVMVSVARNAARDDEETDDDANDNPIVSVRLRFVEGLTADAGVMTDGVTLELEASCLDALARQLTSAIATARHAGLIPPNDPLWERRLELVE